VRSDDERLLTRARELVVRGWCQAGLAQDRDGRIVEPWRSCARAWSPLGALLAALYLGSEGSLDSFRITYTCLALATGGRLEEWNAAPWRTQQHVLSAFDRARDFVPGVRRNLERAAAERPTSPVAASSVGPAPVPGSGMRRETRRTRPPERLGISPSVSMR
jgi:hypothetical protein